MQTTSINQERPGRLFILGAAVAVAVLAGTLMVACGGGSSHDSSSQGNSAAVSSAPASSGGDTADASQSGSAAPSGGGDAATVKSRFLARMNAMKNHDWKSAYSFLSADAQSKCAYSDFKDLMDTRYGGGGDNLFKVANVKVTLSDGINAYWGYPSADISYEDAITLGSSTWVNVDGTWYDADSSATC